MIAYRAANSAVVHLVKEVPVQHLTSLRRNRAIFVVFIGLFSFAALRIAMAIGLEPTAETQANIVTGAMFGATLVLGGIYVSRPV